MDYTELSSIVDNMKLSANARELLCVCGGGITLDLDTAKRNVLGAALVGLSRICKEGSMEVSVHFDSEVSGYVREVYDSANPRFETGFRHKFENIDGLLLGLSQVYKRYNNERLESGTE